MDFMLCKLFLKTLKNTSEILFPHFYLKICLFLSDQGHKVSVKLSILDMLGICSNLNLN